MRRKTGERRWIERERVFVWWWGEGLFWVFLRKWFSTGVPWNSSNKGASNSDLDVYLLGVARPGACRQIVLQPRKGAANRKRVEKHCSEKRKKNYKYKFRQSFKWISPTTFSDDHFHERFEVDLVLGVKVVADQLVDLRLAEIWNSMKWGTLRAGLTN